VVDREHGAARFAVAVLAASIWASLQVVHPVLTPLGEELSRLHLEELRTFPRRPTEQ